MGLVYNPSLDAPPRRPGRAVPAPSPATDAECRPPTLSAIDAPKIFLKYCETNRGKDWKGLSKQQKGKINAICGWFEVAATAKELEVLSDGEGESGAQRTIAEELNHIVRRRIATEFKARTGSVPPALRAGKILKFTTLTTKLSELASLKDNAIDLTPFEAGLPAFRRAVR